MWTDVVSSNIKAVKMDGDDLFIALKNGTEYKYFGPSHHFENLVHANSVSKYHDTFIKGMFPHKKL